MVGQRGGDAGVLRSPFWGVLSVVKCSLSPEPRAGHERQVYVLFTDGVPDCHGKSTLVILPVISAAQTKSTTNSQFLAMLVQTRVRAKPSSWQAIPQAGSRRYTTHVRAVRLEPRLDRLRLPLPAAGRDPGGTPGAEEAVILSSSRSRPSRGDQVPTPGTRPLKKDKGLNHSGWRFSNNAGKLPISYAGRVPGLGYCQDTEGREHHRIEVEQRHPEGKEKRATTVRTAPQQGIPRSMPHNNAAFVRRQTLLDRCQGDT
ncbi:hypothetical protein Purlil1_12925 [Purpureocillium lilacinum]|uniref:Uncharacterized protein n=1 Tax=Purpureocillium lilacinum TaxID=33203 RepID=A0ABR0BFG8_PURLI|nr:hypothetical protein Purlil1_12925 [Purpureocillium lilacinum]